MKLMFAALAAVGLLWVQAGAQPASPAAPPTSPTTSKAAPPAGGTPAKPAPAPASAPTRAPAPAAAPAARDSARGPEQRVDGVAAVVQGEPIFDSEVDEQLYAFLVQSGQRPDSTSAMELRRQILDQLINDRIILQEAKRQQVTVSDADLDKQVSQAITDAKERVGGEQGFQDELHKEGITESDLRERYRTEVRRQMLANQLLRRELNLKLEVTAAEAEAYFKANPKDFPPKPPEIHVALVQIPIEPDPAAKAAAQKRAEELLARVRKGESFTRVAQEASEDPATRASGGDLGFFGHGDVDSTFEQVTFGMKPGQTSGVVETPFGFHIIRVEERDSTRNEVHARHILIRIPVTADDEARAQATAEKVYQEAAKGMDFGALARRYSKFTGPHDANGDLGFLPMTAFSPDFKAALDSLEIGGVTPPLRNQQGFHIFKVLDRRPERPYTLDEIRDQLPDLVRQIKLQKQYNTWVASLRSRARVEIR